MSENSGPKWSIPRNAEFHYLENCSSLMVEVMSTIELHVLQLFLYHLLAEIFRGGFRFRKLSVADPDFLKGEFNCNFSLALSQKPIKERKKERKKKKRKVTTCY